MLGSTVRVMLRDHLISNAKHAALYSVAPTSAGHAGTEYVGGYERQAVKLRSSTNGVVNDGIVNWYRLGAGTIVGVGLFDAATAGNLLVYVPLPAHVAVSANMSWTISDGGLSVALT